MSLLSGLGSDLTSVSFGQFIPFVTAMLKWLSFNDIKGILEIEHLIQ